MALLIGDNYEKGVVLSLGFVLSCQMYRCTCCIWDCKEPQWAKGTAREHPNMARKGLRLPTLHQLVVATKDGYSPTLHPLTAAGTAHRTPIQNHAPRLCRELRGALLAS